jgi:hypothetical protein
VCRSPHKSADEANSPSNLASSDHFGVRFNSAPTELSAESCGTGAPLTTKLVPGSAWKAAESAGLLTQSYAHATRARNCTGAKTRSLPARLAFTGRPATSLGSTDEWPHASRFEPPRAVQSYASIRFFGSVESDLQYQGRSFDFHDRTVFLQYLLINERCPKHPESRQTAPAKTLARRICRPAYAT